MIVDKVEKKRAAKRANDDARYRELEKETERRLSRTDSGNDVLSSAHEHDDSNEKPRRSSEEEVRSNSYERNPPRPVVESQDQARQRQRWSLRRSLGRREGTVMR